MVRTLRRSIKRAEQTEQRWGLTDTDKATLTNSLKALWGLALMGGGVVMLYVALRLWGVDLKPLAIETMKYVLLLLLVLLPGAGQAASLDCSKAKLPTEKLICQDDELSNADDTTATLFSSLPREIRAWRAARTESGCISAKLAALSGRVCLTHTLLKSMSCVRLG